MEFNTAKGLEFILIFGVILGGCVYQLYAVRRDARLTAERRAADAGGAPAHTKEPRT